MPELTLRPSLGARFLPSQDSTQILFERREKCLLSQWSSRDQMDMVGHKAIRPDLYLVSAAPLCHQLQVGLVIFIAEERLLPAVSPLSDVMRQTRCNNTCQSGHHRRLKKPRSLINN